MPRSSLHLPCVLALVLLAAGCRSWQPIDGTPHAVARERPDASFRITRGSDRILLADPVVTDDSIFDGALPGGGIGYSLDEVSFIEERRVSVFQTAVLGGVVVLGIWLYRGWFLSEEFQGG